MLNQQQEQRQLTATTLMSLLRQWPPAECFKPRRFINFIVNVQADIESEIEEEKEQDGDTLHTEILRSLGVRSEVDPGCAGLTLKLPGKKF